MRPSDSSDMIEFNVGGFVYTTSRTTIMSYQDSMLARMCSGLMPTATDTNGRIFIDRDGPLFRYILNYLRDKRLNLPDNFAEYTQLRQEADFYRIEPIISDLDLLFYHKCNQSKLNLISSSASSITSINKINTAVGGLNDNLQVTANKGVYFTIISKLYQGTLESIIGCIRIMSVLNALDSNSKRFLNSLIQPQPVTPSAPPASTTNKPSQQTNNASVNRLMPLSDSFVCECKFMQEEKIICCKPCGLNNTSDASVTNLCQSIIRLAKRYGITTGYWEDMFYLTFDSSIPNREQLCSILNSKYNAKLLNTSVCDRRSSYDDNLTSTLVERWYLPDITCFVKHE